MPGHENTRKARIRVEADDSRLRYHLTSLYALRPIPGDMLDLVQEVGARLATAQHAEND